MARKIDKNNYCIYCLSKGKTKKQSQIKSNNKKMIALDRPYINLSFHRKCYNKIDNMEEFLKETYQIWKKPWLY